MHVAWVYTFMSPARGLAHLSREPWRAVDEEGKVLGSPVRLHVVGALTLGGSLSCRNGGVLACGSTRIPDQQGFFLPMFPWVSSLQSHTISSV